MNNDLLNLFGSKIPGLLTGGTSVVLIALIILFFVWNWIKVALILLSILAVSGLTLSAFKYYIDIKFWPSSLSFSWIWSIFKYNTTRLDISITTIKNPVGSMAPGVLMDGTTPENSTAFLYKAESGKSYLARDTNFAKNGGAFYEIASSNSTTADTYWSKQKDILYTDLKNGGFFEYNSANSNHTSAMKIMMNTKTVTETTKYASTVKNSDNNFLTDYSFGNGFQITYFSSVTEHWHTGKAFRHDLEKNSSPDNLGKTIIDNPDKMIIIVAGKAFRTAWIPSPWKNTPFYQLMMNTDKVTSATNYLLLHSHSNNQIDAYISTDGLKYAKVDLTTGKLTATTINYDYKTGVTPNL